MFDFPSFNMAIKIQLPVEKPSALLRCGRVRSVKKPKASCSDRDAALKRKRHADMERLRSHRKEVLQRPAIVVPNTRH